MRLSDTRTLERLVRWRIPDVPPTQTFDELFRTYPFTLLDAGDTWSLSGPVRAHLDARPATTRGSPGRRRSATGTSAAPSGCCSPTGPSRARTGARELVSEARVDPVDAAARLRLRALWTVIGPFERLVGAEPLDGGGAVG